MKDVLIRTATAGVFVGLLESPEGSDVTLRAARRVWYWKGAATLSELATKGPAFPLECKMPAPVDSIHLFGVIEIIPMTKEACQKIGEVPAWSEHKNN